MMAKLDEIERLLAHLSRAEKVQVLDWIVRDLSGAERGIEVDPEIAGGEPRIVGTRIPVWLLEQSRRLGVSEPELLQAYPVLRAEDLANAWAFVRAHSKEIEQQIRENEAA
jgi:uncharacterized protein (DUF433 family)